MSDLQGAGSAAVRWMRWAACTAWYVLAACGGGGPVGSLPLEPTLKLTQQNATAAAVNAAVALSALTGPLYVRDESLKSHASAATDPPDRLPAWGIADLVRSQQVSVGRAGTSPKDHRLQACAGGGTVHMASSEGSGSDPALLQIRISFHDCRLEQGVVNGVMTQRARQAGSDGTEIESFEVLLEDLDVLDLSGTWRMRFDGDLVFDATGPDSGLISGRSLRGELALAGRSRTNTLREFRLALAATGEPAFDGWVETRDERLAPRAVVYHLAAQLDGDPGLDLGVQLTGRLQGLGSGLTISTAANGQLRLVVDTAGDGSSLAELSPSATELDQALGTR